MEQRATVEFNKRYFGPVGAHKCKDPKTLFCAHIECQRAGLCQFPNVKRGEAVAEQ